MIGQAEIENRIIKICEKYAIKKPKFDELVADVLNRVLDGLEGKIESLENDIADEIGE